MPRATLLRVDNLPGVQAAVRGCSSTALGNRLLARIDAAAARVGGVVAAEWVSTDAHESRGNFKRASRGARRTPPQKRA